MIETTSEHPEQQDLKAFGRGELASPRYEEVESHVANCAACCDALRDTADDSLIARLRGADTDAGLDTSVPRLAAGDARQEAASPPDALVDHPKYRIIRPLGAGGMGTVYQAEHRMMKRDVALKVINPDLTRDSAAVKRFHREVEAAARLGHPNIVVAHDAETAGGIHFLVMEYVEGDSLARHVRRRGPLPIAEACSIAMQTAEGLQHAHELGMVHRDIKPQNLMVAKLASGGRKPPVTSGSESLEPDRLQQPADAGRSPAVIKILDFGLARFAREHEAGGTTALGDDAGEPGSANPSLTRAGIALGTPDYIAPEQARDSRSADIRADIYSLGCTLYYMLSGQVPFPDSSVVGKLVSHSTIDPEPLTNLRPDAPPELLAVLRGMMAKDPANRYQTPAAAATALKPFTTFQAAVGGAPRVGAAASAGAEDSFFDTLASQEARLATQPLQAPKSRKNTPLLVGGIAAAGVAAILIAAVIAAILLQSTTATDSLAAFGDEFDNPKSLDEWTQLDQVPAGRPGASDSPTPTVVEVNINDRFPGGLSVTPASLMWINDSVAWGMWKEIEGDFLIATRVRTRGRANSNGPPERENYQFAGLIARNPASRPGDDDWAIVSLGSKRDEKGNAQPTYKTETTKDSSSVWNTPPGAYAGELRLARLGSRLYALAKFDGDSQWRRLEWTANHADSIDRPDLPARLQVGLAANGGDLIAEYDYVRFAVPQRLEDLTMPLPPAE